MKRHYECTILFRPELSKVQLEQAQNELMEILTADDGETSHHEYWGLRSLAYPIKKLTRAHYVFFHATTAPEAIIEMERRMRIREDIVRYLSVKMKTLSEDPSPMMKTKSYGDGDKKHTKKPHDDKKNTAA